MFRLVVLRKDREPEVAAMLFLSHENGKITKWVKLWTWRSVLCPLVSELVQKRVYWQFTSAMSKLFHRGPMWLQVFFSTKQQHTRPDSFNQLISVFRKLIGQTVCSWLVGTKTCSHTAPCGRVWTCLVYMNSNGYFTSRRSDHCFLLHYTSPAVSPRSACWVL